MTEFAQIVGAVVYWACATAWFVVTAWYVTTMRSERRRHAEQLARAELMSQEWKRLYEQVVSYLRTRTDAEEETVAEQQQPRLTPAQDYFARRQQQRDASLRSLIPGYHEIPEEYAVPEPPVNTGTGMVTSTPSSTTNELIEEFYRAESGVPHEPAVRTTYELAGVGVTPTFYSNTVGPPNLSSEARIAISNGAARLIEHSWLHNGRCISRDMTPQELRDHMSGLQPGVSTQAERINKALDEMLAVAHVWKPKPVEPPAELPKRRIIRRD